MSSTLNLPGVEEIGLKERDDFCVVRAKSEKPVGPACKLSCNLTWNGTRYRRINDAPTNGRAVIIRYKVQRFACKDCVNAEGKVVGNRGIYERLTFVQEGFWMTKRLVRWSARLARVVAIVTLQLAPGCPFWDDQERDEAAVIAWLHDVVEDVEDGEALLEIEGFSRQTIDNVCWLSRGQPHDPGGSYLGWIRTIVEYAPLVVLLVKLADVTDNSDPDRLALLPEADRKRLTRKYAGAKEALQAAARAKGWRA